MPCLPVHRIETRGYGEPKPIADNTVAVGQAQNRRVAFDPYVTGTRNAAEVKGPAPTTAELLKQGKTSPVPAKAAPNKKYPAPAKGPRRPAPKRR